MLRFFGYLLAIALIFAIGIAGYVLLTIKNLPDPELFDQRQISQSTKIYDRAGKVLLYEIHGEEKRTVIPFEQVPEHVKQTTLVIEDSEFYNHSAFDWRSVIRAFYINLTRGKIVQGGSTITQQLAKKAFLSDERTLTRKIKELIIAFRLEDKYTKDEILGLYLNQIPYGSNAYGIEAAAQTFFNKPTGELNLAEAALLAALPNAPSYYSPYGTHTEELMARKNYILEQMEKSGLIDEEELVRYKDYKYEFTPQETGIKAPHFVITIQEYLNNKYGEDFVQNAGLNIVSTLDWDLQQAAEKAVNNGVERNVELYNGHNAALVAQDAATGQILALVGSKDYFDIENDGNFNVATQGLRQPGSAIKPFAYVTAFERGYTPDTVIFDVETDFDTTGEKSYQPHNFDNKFRGPVTFRNALAQSINVPAVKVLYLTGVNNVLETALDFGLTTLTERSRYGLSLALGGGEVKLIDLIGGYSVFAQEGLKHKQSLILEIKDAQGKILEEYKDEAKQVIEAQYTRLINDILSDVEARKALYSSSLYLTIFPNQEVALKTGTTNEYHDAWAIGYTPSLVAGVWVGNNDNTPMQQHGSSILAALPIWNTFMSEALKGKPLETFTRPGPVTANKPILNGQYIINNELHSILYYIDKNNPQGPALSNPAKDSQFEKWENALIKWLQDNPEQFQNLAPSLKSSIKINKPENGGFVKDIINIEVEINTEHDIVKIEVFLNDRIISQKSGNFGASYLYTESIKVDQLELQNKLTIKALDDSSNQTENSIILYRR
ncbi:MAG: transglycosylase domain-containing protein [Patescibacteria group bacterium]